MGNSCFCGNIHFIKDSKFSVCFQKQNITSKSDQVLYEDKVITNEKCKNKKQPKTKMNDLLNYFYEGEKEIINNLKKKGKGKKKYSKKKLNNIMDNKDDKYELMLKRLLEQQNIKKNGPKRRETIRKNGNDIRDLVKNLLIENKNDALNNKNKNDNNTLLIKNKFNKMARNSVTIDKNILMNNININKKKFQEQYFNNRNTIGEVIYELSGGFGRKGSNDS
jgi:hypothetical protein